VSICHIYKETATLVEISCTVGSSLPKSAVNLIQKQLSYTEVQGFIGNQGTPIGFLNTNFT